MHAAAAATNTARSIAVQTGEIAPVEKPAVIQQRDRAYATQVAIARPVPMREAAPPLPVFSAPPQALGYVPRAELGFVPAYQLVFLPPEQPIVRHVQPQITHGFHAYGAVPNVYSDAPPAQVLRLRPAA